jgi:hypothetical protein
MPHGLDQLFWKSDGPIVTGTKGIVANAVLETPQGRRRCLEKVRKLRAGLFNVEALTNRIQQLAERIRPAVSEMGFGTAIRFSAEVQIIQKNIAERITNIDEQLESLRELLRFTNEEAAVLLVGWKTQPSPGDSTLSTTNDASVLHIQTKPPDTIGAWVTKVWLEEGSYRVTARIKARVTTIDPDDRFAGAGLRVQSHRKLTEGSSWDWFPYRESRNPQTRGILPPLKTSRRLSGTNDWTEVTYDFDLRQPMADLEIRCELRANDGEAWFERESLKIRRIRREKPNPAPARP